MDVCAALAKVLKVREDDADILQRHLQDGEFDPCTNVGDDDEFMPSEDEIEDGAKGERVKGVDSTTVNRRKSPLLSTRGSAPRGVAVGSMIARSLRSSSGGRGSARRRGCDRGCAASEPGQGRCRGRGRDQILKSTWNEPDANPQENPEFHPVGEAGLNLPDDFEELWR